MKNPTILKDELSLLRADKSAVIIELRRTGTELKEIQEKILDSEGELKKVKDTIIEETARLDDLRSRAVFVKKELETTTQGLKGLQNSYEISKVRNSQEFKIHLGRIKELSEKEQKLKSEIDKLRKIQDNNSVVYSAQTSEKTAQLRTLNKDITDSEKKLNILVKDLEQKQTEEKRMTKDRLRREDKIRNRERLVDAREINLTKREEDIITMSKDIAIVYGRLKELYAVVKPEVDLDKLITQAI